MESKFTRANGILLHYLDYGGSGPPIVLVHGTSFCAQVWRHTGEVFRSKYHVYAIDQRGHGDSEKPQAPDSYTWDKTANDVVSFLEALDLKDALLMGHSSGGMACMMAAAMHPEHIRKAVLIEPGSLITQRLGLASPAAQRTEPVHSALRRRRVWDSPRQAFESYQGRPPFISWHKDLVWAYVEGGFRPTADGKIELKCPPEVEVQFARNAGRFDPWPYMPNLRCPILLIFGGNGAAFQQPWPSPLERFLQIVPNPKVVNIPDTGHFVPMEKPEDVERAALEFLAA